MAVPVGALQWTENGVPRALELKHDSIYTAGRAPRASVRLSNVPNISAHHVQIVTDRDVAHARVLGGGDGVPVFVNASTALLGSDPVAFKPGDTLTIGNVPIYFASIGRVQAKASKRQRIPESPFMPPRERAWTSTGPKMKPDRWPHGAVAAKHFTYHVEVVSHEEDPVEAFRRRMQPKDNKRVSRK